MPYVLASVAGALMFLACPKFGLWPLVFIAHVPLLIALQDQPWKRRFMLGAITGGVFLLGMQYWIAHTLVLMSGFPWWAAIPCAVIYSMWVGAQWGLFAIAYPLVRRWSGPTVWLFTVPVVFALFEQLYPNLFPTSAASPLYAAPLLLQVADLTGMPGNTWMVILCNCAIVQGIETYRSDKKRTLSAIMVACVVWGGAIGYGVVRTQTISDATVKAQAKVTIIQPNMTLKEKRAKNPKYRMAAYDRTIAMTLKAKAEKPDLIVWPEGAFPYPFDIRVMAQKKEPNEKRYRSYSRKLIAFAKTLNIPFVAGGLRTDGKRIRNSLYFFSPKASEPVLYDKIELIPFGENIPFADTFPALKKAVPGMSHHRAGDDYKVFTAKGLNWIPGICYEALKVAFTRHSLNQETVGNALLNGTNDVWFGDTSAPDQHLMMQTHRAIENRVWLVRATNSGYSAFVDPTGKIRGKTTLNAEHTLTQTVTALDLPLSFFRKYGNLILYLSYCATFFFLAYRQRNPMQQWWAKRNATQVTSA